MTSRIIDLYEGYSQAALILAQGNQQQADYLLNCSWYEWGYRKENLKKYAEWYNKQVKEATGKK